MQEINAKYNLKSLLENYRVVIPLIQRDYAQGRKDPQDRRMHRIGVPDPVQRMLLFIFCSSG